VTIVAAAAWAPGCIFFVDSSSGLQSSECSFQGSTNPGCGACIATSCRSQINACCTDGTCKGDLSYLDGCASGDVASCTALTSGTIDGPTGLLTGIGACVTASCPECAQQVTPVDSGTGATISCTSGATSCSCEYNTFGSGTTTACTAAAFSQGICCRDLNYPTVPGTSCECNPFSCTVDSFGNVLCTSSYDPASSQSPSVSDGMSCCIPGDGQCTCSPNESCDGTPVDGCTAENTGCDGTQVAVSSCSQ